MCSPVVWNRFINYFLPTPDEKSINILLQKLCENPKAKKLYEQAQEAQFRAGLPSITLILASHEEMGHSFDGDATYQTGQLRIVRSLTQEAQLSTLIFELTNFFQVERWNAFFYKAENGYPMRRSVYMKQSEKIEFDGAALHHEIVKYGIQHHGWQPSMDEYASWYRKDFEKIYKSAMCEEHKGYFGENWDRMHKA